MGTLGLEELLDIPLVNIERPASASSNPAMFPGDAAIFDAEQGTHLLADEHSNLQYSHTGLCDNSDSDSDGPGALNDRHVERDVLPETATVVRNVSWASAYILNISGMVGSGIFAAPGTIARSSGSIGLSLLVWVSGAGIAACGLVTVLEYGCMLPRSGGSKVYLEFTYRYPRFFVSVMMAARVVVQGFTANNCIVFSEYLLFGLGIEPTGFARKLGALGLLVFITVAHGCFLKTGIMIQNALGFFKICLMCFMVLTGLFVVAFPWSIPSRVLENVTSNSSWDALWEGSNWGWGTVSLAIFKVYFAYGGYDNVNFVLNEVKDPVRTLKTAAPAALVSCCIMYLLVNAAYFIVVPLEEVKNSGELVAGLFFDKLFGPGFGRTVLPLLVAISVAGNVMVNVFSMARLNQEVARQGFLPFSRLLSSSRPFNAPLGGLMVTFIPTFFIIVLPPPGDIYSFILNAQAYPAQFFDLATFLGLLLLRWRRPDLHRPFKAWLPAVWLGIAVCLVLAAAPLIPPDDGKKGVFGLWHGTYALVGIGVLALATVYWYLWAVAIPKWKGYRLEEIVEVLPDGTSITSFVKVKEH